MGDQFRVKGSTLRSKLDFAGDRLGPKAVQKLSRFLEDAGTPQILDADWYPFALYDGLLRQMADLYFGGDLKRLTAVGNYSAEKALSTTYAPYAVQGEFSLFLKRISALHQRFYSAGRLTVTANGEDFCELELSEAPEISETDLYVASGFYVGAARLMGLEKARCRFTIDGDRVRYRLDWN